MILKYSVFLMAHPGSIMAFRRYFWSSSLKRIALALTSCFEVPGPILPLLRGGRDALVLTLSSSVAKLVSPDRFARSWLPARERQAMTPLYSKTALSSPRPSACRCCAAFRVAAAPLSVSRLRVVPSLSLPLSRAIDRSVWELEIAKNVKTFFDL